LNWLNGKKAENKNGKAAETPVNLSSKCTTYDEHTMTIEELAARFVTSHIDIGHPVKSAGLDSAVAAARLAADGLVRSARVECGAQLAHRIDSRPPKARPNGSCSSGSF
jgi:hypothetical protein